MSWLKRTADSSIGGKLVVAVTGLGLVGFIVAHLAGNLLVFVGPEALFAYAKGLRDYPAVLWGLRLGLIGMTVLHVYFAIRLNFKSRKARPISYAKKTYVEASLASRTMVLTGLLLLAFAVWHLAHLTWRLTSPEIAALGPYDVYPMLLLAFRNPVNAGLYVLAMVLLGLHLCHGVSSLFQSLGINHVKYNPVIRLLGPVLGTALAAAYISIPVSILLGIVG